MLARLAGTLLLAGGLLVGCGGGTTPAASPSAAPSGGASGTATPSPVATPSPAASASPSEDADAQVVEIAVSGGRVSGATGRVEVPLGGEVVLRVTSDVADEVHLHGYDESVDVVAGQPGELRFTADIPGTFEVELEETGTQLTRLLVR